MRCKPLLLGSILLCASAVYAEPKLPQSKSTDFAAELQKLSGNKQALDELAFADQMVQVFGSKPVPVVAVEGYSALRRPRKLKATKPATLVTRLQDVATAFSPADEATIPPEFYGAWANITQSFIPFKLDDVWTVAADTCLTPNANVSGQSPTEALPPDQLFRIFTKSLSDQQLQLACGAGLPYSALDKEQQKLLQDIFRGPVVIDDLQGDEPGKKAWACISDWKARLEHSSFRAHSWFTRVEWPEEERSPGYYLEPPGRFSPLFPVDPTSVFTGYRVAPFCAVPARLKKQVLPFGSGAFHKPIGSSGIVQLNDLIAGINQRLRMSLQIDTRFESNRVFIGDPGISTGEVLKLVAFGLQGAWRKIGSEYFLAVDPEGENVSNMRFREAMVPVNAAINAYQDSMKNAGNVDAMNKWLGPDPLAPVGFTYEQLTRLRGRMAKNPAGRLSSVRFADLDESQQDAIVALTNGKTRYRDNKPITREMLETAVVTSPTIECSLDVEGMGLLSLDSYARFPFTLDDGTPPANTAPGVSPPATTVNATLHAVTVLEVAPLGAAHWSRLFAQCRRKGIKSIYVPVLWDGQTPFASKFFPEMAFAKGADLLQAILASAKKSGIQVIGAIHELAWRLPQSETHWLSKHTDWVDVDCQGRTRRQWAAAGSPNTALRPDARTLAEVDPVVFSDYVRPNAPEVKARLIGLVRELARYKGLSGLALDHWSRVAGTGYNNVSTAFRLEAAPSLGYSDQDRLAFIHSTGLDPVDIIDEKQTFVRIGMGLADPYALNAWSARRYKQDASLAQAMIGEMENAFPRRVTVFNYLSAEQANPLPVADFHIDWQLSGAQPDPPENVGDVVAVLAGKLLAASGSLSDKRGAVPGNGRVLNLAGHADAMWDILDRLPGG